MSNPMTEAQKARPLGTGESEVMLENKHFGGWHRVVGYFETDPCEFVATWTSKAYDTWTALVDDYPQFQRKKPAEYAETAADRAERVKTSLKEGERFVTRDELQTAINDVLRRLKEEKVYMTRSDVVGLITEHAPRSGAQGETGGNGDAYVSARLRDGKLILTRENGNKTGITLLTGGNA